MPNWCRNSLYIVLPAEQADSLAQDITALQQGKDPSRTSVFGHADANEDTPGLLGLLTNIPVKSSLDRTGIWGTKWEIAGNDISLSLTQLGDLGVIELFFHTAWSPPANALENYFIDLAPDANFFLVFDEPGHDFVGYSALFKKEVINNLVLLGATDLLGSFARHYYGRPDDVCIQIDFDLSTIISALANVSSTASRGTAVQTALGKLFIGAPAFIVEHVFDSYPDSIESEREDNEDEDKDEDKD
jgi:hypothetical protein